MRGRVVKAIVAAALAGGFAGRAMALDWESIPLTGHSAYQAVNGNGASAYTGGFPMRVRGVVLANTEDWLDPTPAYTATYVPYAMGGQAELIVQAVEAGDFGGTFCWMGQNYGNLPFKGDPIYSYTDEQWTAELGRLNLFGGDGVTEPIRKGDLVEVRARTGLFYGGKMNINEAHDNSIGKDFEVVLIQAGYGMPSPAALSLSDLKDASDQFIFDPLRAAGAEHYQAALVELRNVRLTAGSVARWGVNQDLTLEDETGRTLGIHLGLNASFGESAAPSGYFDVVGILDQADGSLPHSSGYRLLAMSAGDFTVVPEPSALLAVSVGLMVMLGRGVRRA